MSAVFKVGDVFDRMSELEDDSVDLVLTSPPFGWLRSYLPADHPDKHREIGQEATPADYLDVLLRWTAECRRVLAPHGSLAVELGDSFAGAGGAGGDYDDDGMRGGQPKFDGTGRRARSALSGWPLAKSLVGVPQLYMLSLAYGRNILTGTESPAGMWRVRNVKPWIRTNPPVGALGDKERPATSYVIVACTSANRYFDLDAVRTTPSRPREGTTRHKVRDDVTPGTRRGSDLGEFELNNPAGAPPRDWWHQVDAIIDAEIDRRAGKRNSHSLDGSTTRGRLGPDGALDAQRYGGSDSSVGARGVHIRRALEAAGILTTLEALDISPRGYSGAHYAVFPKELVRQLVDEMAPRRVCVECGEPSRRIVDKHNDADERLALAAHMRAQRENAGLTVKDVAAWFPSRSGGLTGCVSNWETASNVPTGDQWPTLKERLGLSDEFDDLVLGGRCWTESTATYTDQKGQPTGRRDRVNGDFQGSGSAGKRDGGITATRQTLGWSDCGHNNYRPGLVLDPFVGSGTTLAVASPGRDSIGIDLDPRNADLARARVGMFLEVDEREVPA